jgi:hypothetical protein
MPIDPWSEAIQEAIASAPPDQIILPTLELQHPLFVNEQGVYEPVRVVADPGFDVGRDDGAFGHNLKIEDGSTVLFLACMFDFTLPEQIVGKVPEIDVSIDGVPSLLMDDLNAAVTIRADIKLIYREYIFGLDDIQFRLPGLVLKRVKTTLTRTTGTASFADLNGISFPSKLYRPKEYRSLST